MAEVKPEEKLYEICIFLKDIPEALAKTAKVLANVNAKIKTGTIFNLPEYPGILFWSTFVDVSKVEKGVKSLVEKLRRLDVVEDVRFEEPKPLPFEVLHFPILHATTRAIVWPIGQFWAIWNAIEGILKPSGASVLHYDTGKAVGKRIATTLKKVFGVEGMDLVQAIIQAVQATGWGILEAQDIDFKRGKGTIIIRECFEALAWRKKPYNTCHWARGYIAGASSVTFGQPVKVVEVKCLAAGDEYCQFKIQPEKP